VPAIDLLVIGDINPDVLVTAGDLGEAFGQREQIVDQGLLVLGGSATITAVAASRLGARVALAGCVGDDWIGRALVAELTAIGVECRVKVLPQVPTSLTVVVQRGPDRAILTSQTSLGQLDCSVVPDDLLRDCRHVHVGGYFLLPGLWDGLPELFGQARAAGATTSIDPNWDPTEQWLGNLAKTLPVTDVFLPNLAEARLVSGQDEPVAAARKLASSSGGTVAIKLGGDGALAGKADQIEQVTALTQTPVDSTGAGDNFNAGFLVAALQGYSLRESIGLAAACGSLSTLGHGGTGVSITLAQALAAASELSYRAGENLLGAIG
jgi:sugar/nucleoside kinase (ribokinase family)